MLPPQAPCGGSAGTDARKYAPTRECTVGVVANPPAVRAEMQTCHAAGTDSYMSDAIMSFSAGCTGVMASAPGRSDGM